MSDLESASWTCGADGGSYLGNQVRLVSVLRLYDDHGLLYQVKVMNILVRARATKDDDHPTLPGRNSQRRAPTRSGRQLFWRC